MKDLSIGDKLRKIRELKKFTGQELASLSGVPQSTISDIERGKVDPKTSTIEKLSKALGIGPIYFFEHYARTPWDIEEMMALMPESLLNALQKEQFLPYLLLTEKAFQEEIPASVLQKIIDAMIEGQQARHK